LKYIKVGCGTLFHRLDSESHKPIEAQIKARKPHSSKERSSNATNNETNTGNEGTLDQTASEDHSASAIPLRTADIGAQTSRSIIPIVPLQSSARSPTSLSLEERDAPVSAAPHHMGSYAHPWMSAVVAFISAQLLSLSGLILSGRLQTDPLSLLISLSTWLVFYAPFVTIILVGYHLLVPSSFKRSFGAIALIIYHLPRSWKLNRDLMVKANETARESVMNFFVFIALLFFSLNTMLGFPIPLFWEYWFPGPFDPNLFLIYPYGIFVGIGLSWYLAIVRKVHRLERARLQQI